MLLFGDVVLNMDMATLISYHWQKNAVATLVVHPNDHPFDSDLVDIDEDSRIRQLFLKGNKPDFYTNQANAAVHILSPAVFKYIPSGKSDLMVDVIAKMLVDQRPIYGYKTAEYIKDIGAVERFRMVEKDIQSGKVDRLSKKNKRKAVFIDRDGTLVEDVDLLCKIDDLRLFDFSCDSIKNINASEFLSIIVTNQPVVARNLCSTSDVERIHRKLETLLGNEGAYLNDIYFCPHHPDSGYPGENPKFKITCECRKPATGMIQKAAEEYNIDLSASWMIGDTTVDMQMGKNAGLKTALVRTGRAGRDEKFDVKPDMICDNLAVAVDNILRLEEKKQ
jgi:histidinol-phosphate phosphatase family protein